MYKYILISILLLFTICPAISIADGTSVAFINGNPGVTMIGLVKFIVNDAGTPIDYELLDMQWSDQIKVIQLKPGLYGATQYAPMYDKIVSYKTFVVGDVSIIIEFKEL